MTHTHHGAFEAFSVTAALILLALVYVRGWVRVRRLDDAIEGWRGASFIVGLFFIWAAAASPLALLDHEMLTAHMAQHLLLMTVAAPLIWLGVPVKVLLQGLPQQFVQAVIHPLWRSAPVQQSRMVLTHRAVCWFGAVATLVGWHIPALFMLGMQSGMWHVIEQVSFLVSGLLFWWPVVQPWSGVSRSPEWLILLYLFLATLPCDILSGFLVFCDRVVYPAYFSSSQPFGLSALQDQQCAGALMWTCVTVVYMIAGTILTARLLSGGSFPQCCIPNSDSQRSMSSQMTRQSMEVS